MLRSLFALALLAAPAFAQEPPPLGPGGLPGYEPFPLITVDLENDYKAAKLCKGHPKRGGQVFEGEMAIYYKPPKGDVQVMTNEYARRYALDYCWI
jgi:hypothetical protein